MPLTPAPQRAGDYWVHRDGGTLQEERHTNIWAGFARCPGMRQHPKFMPQEQPLIHRRKQHRKRGSELTLAQNVLVDVWHRIVIEPPAVLTDEGRAERGTYRGQRYLSAPPRICSHKIVDK